jgi:EpsI family protein
MGASGRLALTLVLLAMAAATVYAVPPVRETFGPGALYALPMELGDWTASEGAPEWALPLEPRERGGVRRTYHSGRRVAWVAVGLFTRQDDPARRASINHIYPRQNTSLIEGVPFSVPLNATSTGHLPLTALDIHQDRQRLVIVYWNQLGRRAYGSEYAFRLALLGEILFSRRADTLLVRISVPVDQAAGRSAALAIAADLAPRLHAAVSEAFPR